MRSWSEKDQALMKRALVLAGQGLGWTNPNPMVGAVLVRDGKVIGEGFHHRVGGPHAEIEALRDAEKRHGGARGATLYITLEPCCHHGRTPPCTQALIKAGIAQVIIAARDPNPLVSGKGIAQLKKAGMVVEPGLLSDIAEKQNEIFFHVMREKKPFVALKMSISLDGKISPAKKRKGSVFYLIGEEALNRVHHMRQQFDAICVGVETLLQDDPLLNTRLKEKDGLICRHPRPVILDSKARTPTTAKILKPINNRPAPLIVVGPKAPAANLRKLKKCGAEILVIKKNRWGLDLKVLLRKLNEMEVTSLMVEGGAHVAKSFLEQGLVNRLDLAIAPMLIPDGIAMFPSLEKKNSKALAKIFASLEDTSLDFLGRDYWLSGTPKIKKR